MPHPLARREAIESVLGDILDENREPMPQLNPHIVPPSVKEKEDDESRPGTSKGSKSRPGSRGGNGSKPGSPNASGGMFGTAVNSRKGLPSGGPAHISTLSNIAGMAHHARNKVNSNKLHQPHGIHNSRSSGSGASPSPSAGDTAVNTDANSVANTGTNTPIRGLSPAQSPSASNKDLLDRLHQNQGKTLSKSAKKLLMGRAPSVPAFLVSKTSPLLNLQFPLTECILRMHKYVGIHFQKYFSRYILISDIPPPIKEHILSDVCAVAPEWPPEPVYFNNILDIYADRRKYVVRVVLFMVLLLVCLYCCVFVLLSVLSGSMATYDCYPLVATTANTLLLYCCSLFIYL